METKTLTEEQKESRRVSQRKWREKNKEYYNLKSNEYTKAWYQRNKESVLEKKKTEYVSRKIENP
jgi:hypothetical protein